MAAVSDSDRMVTSYFVNIFILTVSFGALPQSSGGQADLGSRGSPWSQVRGASHLQEHWARWGRPAWPATQESSEWSACNQGDTRMAGAGSRDSSSLEGPSTWSLPSLALGSTNLQPAWPGLPLWPLLHRKVLSGSGNPWLGLSEPT